MIVAFVYVRVYIYIYIYAQNVTNVRVTTCLENLEMSANLAAVREMSGILLKKSCQGKVA